MQIQVKWERNCDSRNPSIRYARLVNCNNPFRQEWLKLPREVNIAKRSDSQVEEEKKKTRAKTKLKRIFG